MSTATLDRPRHTRGRDAVRTSPEHSGCCGSICAATESRCRCGCCCCRCRWPPCTSAASKRSTPTEAARAGFAASIMASPAQRALYGQVYNDSLGAVGIWKAGMFHLLIAVAVILTVIRHTRADEETGRTELIDSTAIGRYASLSAALMLSFGASIATGAIGAAGLLTTDCPGRRVAGFRGGAGRLRPGVHRRRRGGRAAVAERHGSPAAPRSPCWGPRSRCAPSAMPAPARCRGSRRWAGRCKSGRTRVITGGSCCCIWRRRPCSPLVAYRLLAGRDVGAGLIAERAGPGTARTAGCATSSGWRGGWTAARCWCGPSACACTAC